MRELYICEYISLIKLKWNERKESNLHVCIISVSIYTQVRCRPSRTIRINVIQRITKCLFYYFIAFQTDSRFSPLVLVPFTFFFLPSSLFHSFSTRWWSVHILLHTMTVIRVMTHKRKGGDDMRLKYDYSAVFILEFIHFIPLWSQPTLLDLLAWV